MLYEEEHEVLGCFGVVARVMKWSTDDKESTRRVLGKIFKRYQGYRVRLRVLSKARGIQPLTEIDSLY